MQTTRNAGFPQLQLRPGFLSGWTFTLLAAFLTLGFAVPNASATCVDKNLARNITAAMLAAPLAGGSALAPTMAAPIPTAAAATPLPAGASAQNSIVGLWNVTFAYQGQVVDVAFDAWHSDQTEILNDYTDPIEGNVCLGVWAPAGPNVYKLKHPSWVFDANGNLLGTEIIRETVKLSANGQSYSGSYTLDIYDVSGNFLEELAGSLKATRITVD